MITTKNLKDAILYQQFQFKYRSMKKWKTLRHGYILYVMFLKRYAKIINNAHDEWVDRYVRIIKRKKKRNI